MHHLRTTLLDFAKALILLVVIGVGAATLSAQSNWTPPSQTPPAGNAAAPINVSNLSQWKRGPLFVGTTATLPYPLTTTFDVLGLASTTMLSTDNLLVSKAATFVATPVGSPMKLLTFTTQGLTIADGTQGAGKVLTSDASGLARWETISTAPAGGSGLQIIGPITDASGTATAHQVSFNLSAASEVVVTAYAQMSSDAGGAGYVKLLVDGALVRTNYYGEECGRYCGGGTASVVLTARQTLAPGSHTIKVESPGSRPAIYTTPEGGGVQFYVYVLNGGGGGSSGSTGSTGPVGISLTDIRTSLEYVSCADSGSASSASCSATCSAGKKVIGGGCTASFRSGGPSSGTSGSLAPNTSAPNAGRDAWVCAAGPVASNTSASVVGNAVCL